MDKNEVFLRGIVASKFEFDHEVFGENFYKFSMETLRLSGERDPIMVLVSERLINPRIDMLGKSIEIYGRFASYNKNIDGQEKSKLILYVFAQEMWQVASDKMHFNRINLEGTICKEPVFRTTPSGREIVDIFLAVNGRYGKSSYIPCIAWGRNAKYLATFSVGDNIDLQGRIQSRIYQKNEKKYIAYEVSIATFKEQ